MLQEQDLIKAIREFEAKHGIKPATIKKLNCGSVRVTFDATALYQIGPEDYSPETKGKINWLKVAWNWLNDRDTSFDDKTHLTSLNTALSKLTRSGTLPTVSVEKRQVKLPIPYFDIPLPFFKRAGTLVRDHKKYATQPIKITLQFSENNTGEQTVKDIITAATTSSTMDGSQGPLYSSAKRISWNPVKWLLHGIACLIPYSIAQHVNKILPNKFIKASRPREWGTDLADCELDTPFINSGLIATACAPMVVFKAPVAWLENRRNPIKPGQSTASSSFFPATRTRLIDNTKSEEINTRIEEAINKCKR